MYLNQRCPPTVALVDSFFRNASLYHSVSAVVAAALNHRRTYVRRPWLIVLVTMDIHSMPMLDCPSARGYE